MQCPTAKSVLSQTLRKGIAAHALSRASVHWPRYGYCAVAERLDDHHLVAGSSHARSSLCVSAVCTQIFSSTLQQLVAFEVIAKEEDTEKEATIATVYGLYANGEWYEHCSDKVECVKDSDDD